MQLVTEFIATPEGNEPTVIVEMAKSIESLITLIKHVYHIS